jgi:hypothetical protein
LKRRLRSKTSARITRGPGTSSSQRIATQFRQRPCAAIGGASRFGINMPVAP